MKLCQLNLYYKEQSSLGQLHIISSVQDIGFVPMCSKSNSMSSQKQSSICQRGYNLEFTYTSRTVDLIGEMNWFNLGYIDVFWTSLSMNLLTPYAKFYTRVHSFEESLVVSSDSLEFLIKKKDSLL